MQVKSIGFTGTRNELPEPQRAALERLLTPSEYGLSRPIFHHGACKGADSFAATVAWGLNYDVIAHPGKSAHGGDNEWLCPIALEHSNEVRETKTHFARNRDIVNETELLIACPQHSDPITAETKGGTAFTISYARKQGKPVWIVRPNGIVER
jgi:hypothetical protein